MGAEHPSCYEWGPPLASPPDRVPPSSTVRLTPTPKESSVRMNHRLRMLSFAAGTLLFASAASASFTVPIRAGGSIHFAWVGDLNGDGRMDYLIDRNTENPQRIEAYSDNGTFLWEVNFGYNSANQDNISPGPSTIDVG